MSSNEINNNSDVKRRRVARACDGCRRKKIRCDGAQPGSDPPLGHLAIDGKGHTRYIGDSSNLLMLKYTKNITRDQIIVIPREEFFHPKSEKTSKEEEENIRLELPPKEISDKLLEIYWKDMYFYMPIIDKQDLMEKYNRKELNRYQTILLYAILAITLKYNNFGEDPNNTEDEKYFERAKELLKEEFEHATLPIIQAILLLALHQLGKKNSRPWIYIGLAIRLAQDMGIHRDSANWKLDEKEAEIRRRTWWACIIIDSFISATLVKLDEELNEWRDNLPIQFKYDNINRNPSLNNSIIFIHLLYYTTQILLHPTNITHIYYRGVKNMEKIKPAWCYGIFFFYTAISIHVINILSEDERFKEIAKQGLRMTIKCFEPLLSLSNGPTEKYESNIGSKIDLLEIP
ncbi:237_t:CDS:2, partial [Diversispora eburnea]